MAWDSPSRPRALRSSRKPPRRCFHPVPELVGASRAHIRGPFIVEGALYGFVATIVTLLIFIPITLWFGKHMTDFFQGINLFSYYLTHIYEFVGILLVFGIGLGAFSSLLATRRYLQV